MRSLSLGTPHRHKWNKREVTVFGRDGSPTSISFPQDIDVLAHTRFSILWPAMYRKIQPQRTPAPMQHMLKQIQRGVLDETHTQSLTHTH